jgi:hypothetical protein
VKFVGALLLVMLAVGGASYLVLRAAPAGGCEDALLEDVPSPNGRNIAARFSHRCGSAPGIVQVSLRMAGNPFSPDERSTVFAARGAEPVRLGWRDAQTLVVETSADNLIEPRREWHDVAIVIRRIH